MKNALYDLLVRLGNFSHDPIEEVTLCRGEARILWPVSIYETDTAIVSSPCGLNGGGGGGYVSESTSTSVRMVRMDTLNREARSRILMRIFASQRISII